MRDLILSALLALFPCDDICVPLELTVGYEPDHAVRIEDDKAYVRLTLVVVK